MKTLKSLIEKNRNHLLSVGGLLLTLLLTMGIIAQPAQAETTYVITDGTETITHTTRSSNPETVLSEAGLTLDTDDTYTTQETREGRQIIVTRAHQIRLMNCGKEILLYGEGETVGELLNRNGISVPDSCFLSVPKDTPVTDGMEIAIDQVIRQQEQYTVELPFETEYLSDDSLEVGETAVITEGVPGQAVRTASVVYLNGEEQNRVVTEETVVKQPVNERIARGTGKNSGRPIIGNGKIIMPSGDVLTYYKTGKFLATAYTKTDAGCTDHTATGTPVRTGVVAVDPTVIPYGTRMFVQTVDGSFIYGVSTAEDCGGAIIGNRLDLYMNTTEECFQFGARDCTVYFLGDANWRPQGDML